MTHALSSPPPEWAPQDTLLIGWPSHFDPWDTPFETAREEVAALANAILSQKPTNGLPQTGVTLVLEGEAAETAARKMVPGASIINTPCGDTWLRDTAPIFSRRNGVLETRRFRFNGWGEKYIYPGDADLSARLVSHFETPDTPLDFVLEGGSVDWDGEGRLLTTDECLLNENRNAGWSRAHATEQLQRAFGVKDVVWIAQGLLNDHTDGHIDNLARFIAPGHVVCQAPNGADDPHAERLLALEDTLRRYEGALGKLTVSTIPSPGQVLDDEGEAMPASHMNFVITNQAVLVPAYNDEAHKAVEALQSFFPDRKVMASSSRAILTGGGAFHCISQQIPSAEGQSV